ncbi:MAG: hypothetical protein AAB427_15790 [Chloroflexota bacterium]
MTFTIADFHDLVVLLENNPEWRAEVRRLVLTEDILTLPQFVRQLAQTVAELSQSVAELSQSVAELSQSVAELAEAQKRTEVHLSRLETRFGVTVEEEAADVLRVVLEKKGFRAVGEAFNLRLNGEVDVVLPVQDASGRQFSAVLEAKARLSWRAVEAWSKRMRSPDFRAALKDAGVAGPYLVYVYGMRADLSARQAAETFGIGLMTGRGEEVAPQGEV